jgi:hypothetical protein
MGMDYSSKLEKTWRLSKTATMTPKNKYKSVKTVKGMTKCGMGVTASAVFMSW